jgi:uncharacterized membrane protein
MMRLNLVWLLTIVVLPFPTEIIGAFDTSRFTAGLYAGTILALSVCQSAITWMIHGHKDLEKAENPVSKREVTGSLVLTGLTLVAFLLAAFVPGVGFYALLLLLISPVVMRVWGMRSTDQPRTHTDAQQ